MRLKRMHNHTVILVVEVKDIYIKEDSEHEIKALIERLLDVTKIKKQS